MFVPIFESSPLYCPDKTHLAYSMQLCHYCLPSNYPEALDLTITHTLYSQDNLVPDSAL